MPGPPSRRALPRLVGAGPGIAPRRPGGAGRPEPRLLQPSGAGPPIQRVARGARRAGSGAAPDGHTRPRASPAARSPRDVLARNALLRAVLGPSVEPRTSFARFMFLDPA